MSRREEKHLKREDRNKQEKRKKQIRRIRLFTVCLTALVLLAVFSAYRHYKTYPANVVDDSITAFDINLDSMTITWDPPRNATEYHIFYTEQDEKSKAAEKSDSNADAETVAKWNEKTVKSDSIKIEGLAEGVTYSFVIRADNQDYQGHYSGIRNFTTQQKQKIEIDSEMIKFTGSDPFMIDARANTNMTFKSSDSDIIKVDKTTGRAETVGPGKAVVTVKAEETDEFTGDKKTIAFTVYDAHPVKIKGSKASIMYNVSTANCEAVVRVKGSGGATIPQSLAYTGKKYMVVFGMYGPTRIVRYNKDGSGRKVIKPKVSLGHPNGATYEPDRNLLYCLKGQGTAGFTLYDIKSKEYLIGNFDRSCSGIAYDSVRKCLYTTGRTAICQYDLLDFSRIKKRGMVHHDTYMSIQDSACYDGILMHCLSDANDKHGTNYIDLYDIRHDKYIGTISCRLSEVESAIVNEDGFLEILSNGRGDANYIWRTDVNIKLLAKEFH